MEGFNKQERETPVEAERIGQIRDEKIKIAEQTVFEEFDKKLAEVLERIGKNPYFRDLEQTV